MAVLATPRVEGQEQVVVQARLEPMLAVVQVRPQPRAAAGRTRGASVDQGVARAHPPSGKCSRSLKFVGYQMGQ